MFGFGSSKPKKQFNILDTVERLCERISTSELLEDRRDAVRGLKGLSRKYRVHVGAQGLPVLAEVLRNDTSDTEITLLAVDALFNVMCDDNVDVMEDSGNPSADDTESEALSSPGGSQAMTAAPKDLGVQLTEMFIKEHDVIPCLLTALEDFDFQLRWAIVRFIRVLLENAQTKVQEIVLTSPTAVSKVIDLLSDPREVIRNESIILLMFLSNQNTPIQKIIAFEGVFEKVLNIIEAEGFSDGLIVVEDCINLILELLRQNVSNLSFFLENGFTQQISKFFNFSTKENESWPTQKIQNVVQMLNLVQNLVSPQNPQQTISAFQKVLHKHGVLNKVAVIVVSPGLDWTVLSEAIVCIGNMIANNRTNQNFFENVMTLQTPPKPSILWLLMAMVNEKQKLAFRTAVLYCFHSYLLGNEDKKADVINTLLPSKVDTSSVTSGQLLCRGLFSRDSVSNWLCSVALSYALNDNQKEKLLRVQLATSIGQPPVTLMQHAVSILTNNDSSSRTKIGIMILLCTWLNKCPTAVTSLLKIPSTISFFISHLCDTSVYPKDVDNVSRALAAFLLGICHLFNEDNRNVCEFDKKGIKHIVEKRMGLEMYKRNMALITMSDSFSKSTQKTYLNVSNPDALILDFEIVTLFKSLESKILDSISGASSEASKEVEALKCEVSNLKEVVRKKEEEVRAKQSSISELSEKLTETCAENENLKYQINVISTATPLVSAANVQTNTNDPLFVANGQSNQNGYSSDPNQKYGACPDSNLCPNQWNGAYGVTSSPEYKLVYDENMQLRARVEEMTQAYNDVINYNSELQSQLQSLNDQLSKAASTDAETMEKLKWYETQYPTLQQQYEQVYSSLYELQTQFNQQFDPDLKIQQLQEKLFQCEGVNAQWVQQNEYQNQQIASHVEKISELNINNEALLAQVSELQTRVSSLESEKADDFNGSNGAVSDVLQNGMKSNGATEHDNQDVSSKMSVLSIDTLNSAGSIENLELMKKYEDLQKEHSELKSDQDDLLLLLADQDSKLKILKKRIRDREAKLASVRARLRKFEVLAEEDNSDANSESSDDGDDDDSPVDNDESETLRSATCVLNQTDSSISSSGY